MYAMHLHPNVLDDLEAYFHPIEVLNVLTHTSPKVVKYGKTKRHVEAKAAIPGRSLVCRR